MGAGAGHGECLVPRDPSSSDVPIRVTTHAMLGVSLFWAKNGLFWKESSAHGNAESCKVSLVFRSPRHHRVTVPQAGGCVCTPDPSPAGVPRCTRLLLNLSTAETCRGAVLSLPGGHRGVGVAARAQGAASSSSSEMQPRRSGRADLFPGF